MQLFKLAKLAPWPISGQMQGHKKYLDSVSIKNLLLFEVSSTELTSFYKVIKIR